MSPVRIGQIAAQERQGKTMAPELVTGTSQLHFISLYTQRSEQFRTGIAG
jgi:hypothetical protein